jgi:hypothetical protein
METEGTSDRKLPSCRVIPERGSWIEVNMTKKEALSVRTHLRDPTRASTSKLFPSVLGCHRRVVEGGTGQRHHDEEVRRVDLPLLVLQMGDLILDLFQAEPELGGGRDGLLALRQHVAGRADRPAAGRGGRGAAPQRRRGGGLADGHGPGLARLTGFIEDVASSGKASVFWRGGRGTACRTTQTTGNTGRQ